MENERLKILKREIIGADINDISKGQLLLAVEAGDLSDFVLEKLYDSLVSKREESIAPEILARNADVNDNFIEVLKNLTKYNFIESMRLLHVKYGLKYHQLATACKFSKQTMYMTGNGTFVPSERLIEKGIINIKEYYLGEFYADILNKI